MSRTDIRLEERRAADTVRDERLAAIELAAGRQALKVVTTQRRPVRGAPLVGAAVKRDPELEYEVVPLPLASDYLGCSLGGPIDMGMRLRGPG